MSRNRAVAIIPARLASTRFPEKILAARTGRTLIQHVHDAATRCRSLARVVVACDHPRIEAAVRAFGGEAVMTSPDHPNGTARLAEAAAILGLGDDEFVVNVQGDEPEIDPGVIDAAVDALGAAPSDRVVMATVASPFAPAEDPADPAIVKVVLRRDGTALYFSRARIPFDRDGAGPGAAVHPLKHVGIYVYRAAFLRRYAAMAPTPLEAVEKLEQLRVLEHGLDIAVAVRRVTHHGIDTPEQYEAFVQRWQATPRG